jgi:hypothetical protein
MNIIKAIDNIGTVTDLKRVSSAYVIDYRNLTDEELREALKKTSPQYYFEDNINKTLSDLLYKADRDTRTLVPLFLQNVLIDKDNFMSPQRETDTEVIKYQQSIVDKANEDLFSKTSSRKKSFEMFNYLLECAWEYNDSISPEEKNLIEKVRTKLKITQKEYRVLEAKLGKYPKPANQLHNLKELEDLRRTLQTRGLLFPVRDNDNTTYDVIPDEIAHVIRKFFKIELKSFGYRKLLDVKYVRSKKYLTTILKKCEINTDDCDTLSDLQETCIEQVNPSTVLGGLSPRDGIPVEDLKKWCAELDINVSGTKEEIVKRIVDFYDNLHTRTEQTEDERKVWYKYYQDFASRNLSVLRSQQLSIRTSMLKGVLSKQLITFLRKSSSTNR